MIVDERWTVTLSSGESVTVSDSQFTLLGADSECVAHRFEIAHSANAALMQWSRDILTVADNFSHSSSKAGFAWVAVHEHAAKCSVVDGVAEEVRTARIVDLFNELESSLRGISGPAIGRTR